MGLRRKIRFWIRQLDSVDELANVVGKCRDDIGWLLSDTEDLGADHRVKLVKARGYLILAIHLLHQAGQIRAHNDGESS